MTLPIVRERFGISAQNWLAVSGQFLGLDLTGRYVEYRQLSRVRAQSIIATLPNYLIPQPDIDRLLRTAKCRNVALCLTEPEHGSHPLTDADLAEYDCGIAYFATHRAEFRKNLRRIQFSLAQNPSDRYTPVDNPGEGHMEFNPSNRDCRGLLRALLAAREAKLTAKLSVYDPIVYAAAIKTLGFQATEYLNFYFYESGVAPDAETESRVVDYLRDLEYAECVTESKPYPPCRSE